MVREKSNVSSLVMDGRRPGNRLSQGDGRNH